MSAADAGGTASDGGPSAVPDFPETTLTDAIADLYGTVLDPPPPHVAIESRGKELKATVAAPRSGVERTLVEAGERDLVWRERQAMRDVLGPRLRAMVERTLQVKVVRLSGASDVDTGLETLVFGLDRAV